MFSSSFNMNYIVYDTKVLLFLYICKEIMPAECFFLTKENKLLI